MEVIDFSNKYYHTGAALAVAAGSGIEPTPEGVAGLTIGIQTATIHQTYANTYFGDATIREYQTQDEANQDLFAGRIDAHTGRRPCGRRVPERAGWLMLRVGRPRRP